jgi:hypothetical protein
MPTNPLKNPENLCRGKRLLNDEGVYLAFELADYLTVEDSLDFPCQCTVEIIDDSGTSYPLGLASKTHEQQLKMPYCRLQLQGEAVTHAYTLRFKHLSHTIAEYDVIAAIENSVPWIFVQQDDEWILIGTASLSTRADIVRVLYPQFLQCDDSEPIVIANKFCITASGIIELQRNEQRFLIQTNIEQAMLYHELRGDSLVDGILSSSLPTYLGLPELWIIDKENQHQTHQQIPSPSLTSANPQGIYELRFNDMQGNLLLYKKCALLPEKFALHLGNGQIEIVHSDNAYISCASPLAKHIKTTDNAHSRVIEFDINHPTLPSHLDITLRWANKREEALVITVPFPISGGRLLNANHDDIADVAIDQLHGVQIRLLNENPQRHITLTFSLNNSEFYLQDNIQHTGEIVSIQLLDYQAWLQQLLAITPDSFVCLTVHEQEKQQLHANIRQTRQIPITRTQRISSLTEINSLSEAQTIENNALRQLIIRHQLKQLSRDFAAADWQHLQNLQTSAPLLHHEIWQAAVLDNRVLVALVLQLDCAFMQRFSNELLVCWELISLSDWLIVMTRYKNHLVQNGDNEDTLKQQIEKLDTLSPSLYSVSQFLQQHLYGLTDTKLSEDTLLQLADAQQQLTQRHTHWSDFLQSELSEYQPHIAELINVDNANSVTLLPLSLAYCCVTEQTTWQQSTVQLFKVKQLKAFDEHWFNTAFGLALSYLSRQANYLQPLLQEVALMINADENELVAEIAKQLDQANQEIQGLQADVQSLQGGEEALEALLQENQELNSTIDKLNAQLKKRDQALLDLLEEIKKLNAKISDIRSQLAPH